jgi:hypothetical protein
VAAAAAAALAAAAWAPGAGAEAASAAAGLVAAPRDLAGGLLGEGSGHGQTHYHVTKAMLGRQRVAFSHPTVTEVGAAGVAHRAGGPPVAPLPQPPPRHLDHPPTQPPSPPAVAGCRPPHSTSPL